MTTGRYYPQFFDAFKALLEAARGQRIAVVGHARPDGDCIGSQVALAHALRGFARDVVCVNSDAVPRRLTFLVDDMVFLNPDQVLAEAEPRLAIYVDCADHARAGERLKARYPFPLGNIDHHMSNVGYAGHNLIDNTSAATCEILAGMIFDQGIPVDPVAAQALYTGILTDTGQFRFNSTTRRCFLLAGDLVERGASPVRAGYELYERESAGKLQLLQRFLASLKFECGGRVCVGLLPAGIFEETGTSAEDTEGLVDYARSIDGVDIGVLIEERSNGSVKASLRAKEPAYRVDLIAAEFGGGGHACAAGLNLRSGQPEFYAKLIAALTDRLATVEPTPNV